MTFDRIVPDSSLYANKQHTSLLTHRDGVLRTGIVREELDPEEGSTIPRYIVDVDAGIQTAVICRPLYKFGGVYNYEEYNLKPYAKISGVSGNVRGQYNTRSGDIVLVAYLNGDSREGVILGGISHPARKPNLAKNQPAYFSEFNGLQQKIENSGAYTVTFMGKPINEALLDTPAPPVPPVYNPLTSGSYYKFEDNGSWKVGDGALPLEQSIYIDKAGGNIKITSGLLTITLDKKANSMKVSNKDTQIDSISSIKMSTSNFEVQAISSAKIKSPKVAIGFGGVEVLDTICKLVDALSEVVVTSPVGPCNPFGGSPNWLKVIALKNQLSMIKGSL